MRVTRKLFSMFFSMFCGGGVLYLDFSSHSLAVREYSPCQPLAGGYLLNNYRDLVSCIVVLCAETRNDSRVFVFVQTVLHPEDLVFDRKR